MSAHRSGFRISAFLLLCLTIIASSDRIRAYGPSHSLEPLPADSNPTRIGFGRGVAPLALPRYAPRHILVKLGPQTDPQSFVTTARGRGMSMMGRVYGTNWFRLRIPQGTDPLRAAVSARSLNGVVSATPDAIIHINDTIPNDPFFKDDPDPSSEPCDPTFDPNCDTNLLTDQWGLFKVGAPAAWDTQRGVPSVVIAVTDSGLDLDHDDLYGNVWTNPDDPPDGIDNDHNGFVDDVHGADFCGDNVGDPFLDDPASQDPNPDIPMGGEWVIDDFAFPFGVVFVGDPAVGDAVDNDGNLLIDAGVFHGTFVAGVLGAMTNNINPVTGLYEGMAGTAWNCKIMPVRIINAEGWGFGSDAAAAIRYAADEGAKIINASWGIALDPNDPALMAEVQVIREAVLYAAGKGVIIVAAAGNSGSAGVGVSGLDFPGIMREVISVGASNWLDQRSEFSSTAIPGEIPDNGIDDDNNGWIDDVLDVMAPGELIWSTYVLNAYDALLYMFFDLTVEPGTPSYNLADGTSFSTPLVSGYVALLLSQNPGATLSQVRTVLRTNALDILDPNGFGQNLPGYDVYSGFGRVRMVISNIGPPSNNPPVLVPLGTPGLTNDGVTPDTGSKTTSFRFRIKYKDADGEQATFVRVHVINGSGIDVAGSPKLMKKGTGTPVTGVTYYFNWLLPIGSHRHYFEASDGKATVRLPASGAFNGPIVN